MAESKFNFGNLAGGLAAAVPSIFGTISGIIQRNKGMKMMKNNARPIYRRPSEVGQGLALSEQQYLNGGMPGTANLIDNIGSANANASDMAIQAASSGGDALDAITKLNYNQNQQFNNVAAQEAEFKAGQLDNYQQQLGIGAQYADKEFEYNQNQPYQDRAAAASAMIGAGNTNVGNGLNGVSQLATTALMGGMFSGNPKPKKSMFNPLDAALTAPLNFTNKRLVYNPYDKSVVAGS